MRNPLMIQKADDLKIEHLMKELGISKKIEVVRAGLALLEKKSERLKIIQRWRRAAKLVAKNSYAVNKEFQKHSRIESD